jgi:uncharacterized membrane-anchored protein
VEGLSIAAIVYYVVGLVGYVIKGVKAGGLPLNADLAIGLAVPVAAVAAFMVVRRARHRIHDAEAAHKRS